MQESAAEKDRLAAASQIEAALKATLSNIPPLKSENATLKQE